MSAYVVGKTHIDGIVKAALDLFPYSDRLTWYVTDRTNGTLQKAGELRDYTDADAVGQMLWAENHRSVNARYREQTECPPYTFERLPGLVERAKHLPLVFTMLHCYEYQSCESDDWSLTEAHAFVRAMEARMIRMIPGYREAGSTGWELSDRNAFGTAKVTSISDMMIAQSRRVDLR